MIPANYSTISFPSLGIEVNPGRTLALGAVIAAEFLNGKRGVYTMDDLLK